MHLETARRITISELAASVRYKLAPAIATQVSNEGTNLNTWFPYLPSATAILAGRLAGASPLVLLYMGRLTNLAVYAALVFLAFHLAPQLKVPLFVVALCPMVLHQAASLSWDSFAFALAFLFCALLVRISRKTDRLSRGELFALAAGVCSVSLCKVDIALLPLTLLIPANRFGRRRNQVLFLGACIVVAITLTAAWQSVNRANFALFQISAAQRGIRFPNNIWYLYFNTGYLLDALARTALANWYFYLNSFVGMFGWLAVPLPQWAVWSYTALFIVAGAAGDTAIRWTLFQRVVFAAVIILGVSSVFLAMWLAETPLTYIQTTILQDTGLLPGIQGRHFVPFAVPLLLLITVPNFKIASGYLIVAASLILAVLNCAGLLEICMRFYAS